MAQADTDNTSDTNVRPFPGAAPEQPRVPGGVQGTIEQRPAKRKNVARSKPIVTNGVSGMQQLAERSASPKPAISARQALRELISLTVHAVELRTYVDQFLNSDGILAEFEVDHARTAEIASWSISTSRPRRSSMRSSQFGQ